MTFYQEREIIDFRYHFKFIQSNKIFTKNNPHCKSTGTITNKMWIGIARTKTGRWSIHSRQCGIVSL